MNIGKALDVSNVHTNLHLNFNVVINRNFVDRTLAYVNANAEPSLYYPDFLFQLLNRLKTVYYMYPKLHRHLYSHKIFLFLILIFFNIVTEYTPK